MYEVKDNHRPSELKEDKDDDKRVSINLEDNIYTRLTMTSHTHRKRSHQFLTPNNKSRGL